LVAPKGLLSAIAKHLPPWLQVVVVTTVAVSPESETPRPGLRSDLGDLSLPRLLPRLLVDFLEYLVEVRDVDVMLSPAASSHITTPWLRRDT